MAKSTAIDTFPVSKKWSECTWTNGAPTSGDGDTVDLSGHTDVILDVTYDMGSGGSISNPASIAEIGDVTFSPNNTSPVDIGINNGTIDTTISTGTITTNNGTITHMDTGCTVSNNAAGGVITALDGGTVTSNSGTIAAMSGGVVTNTSTGLISLFRGGTLGGVVTVNDNWTIEGGTLGGTVTWSVAPVSVSDATADLYFTGTHYLLCDITIERTSTTPGTDDATWSSGDKTHHTLTLDGNVMTIYSTKEFSRGIMGD